MIVENNLFRHTRMSGILIENDASGWYESGCVRNMKIEDNYFIRCGEPVIHINPRNRAKNDAVHQNVNIVDNEFDLRGSKSVRAKSTTGLQIAHNRIFTDARQADDTIEIIDCQQVTIEDNQAIPLIEQLLKDQSPASQ